MNTPKINKVLNLLVKLAILLASYLYIYFQLTNKKDIAGAWDQFGGSIPANTLIFGLSGIILMMLFNWSVEAFKWKYLIRKTESISFLTAFRAVWAGITVSTFTPNRVGEYFGRVFILKNTNPWQGAFMTIVGSLAQLLITLIFGFLALGYFMVNHASTQFNIPSYLFVILAFIFLLIIIASIILFFNVRWFEPLLRRLTLKRWTKLREHLKIFATFSSRELLIVLLLSLLRYCIFSLQFYLLMRLFQVPIPLLDGLVVIACIYLVMSAVPTVALTELGVRGSLTIFFLDIYVANNYLVGDTAGIGAVSAATVIWVINLVVPALVGGLFVLQLKFFRK